MKVTYNSETTLNIDLPNGKSLCILYSPTIDEVTIISQGEGHRHIKEVQNRSDGHSSVTLNKQS